MIQLFSAGGEMITVNEFGFEHYLEEGWGFTIPGKPPIAKVEVADSKVTVSDESSKKPSETSKLSKTTTKTAAG